MLRGTEAKHCRVSLDGPIKPAAARQWQAGLEDGGSEPGPRSVSGRRSAVPNHSAENQKDQFHNQ